MKSRRELVREARSETVGTEFKMVQEDIGNARRKVPQK